MISRASQDRKQPCMPAVLSALWISDWLEDKGSTISKALHLEALRHDKLGHMGAIKDVPWYSPGKFIHSIRVFVIRSLVS